MLKSKKGQMGDKKKYNRHEKTTVCFAKLKNLKVKQKKNEMRSLVIKKKVPRRTTGIMVNVVKIKGPDLGFGLFWKRIKVYKNFNCGLVKTKMDSRGVLTVHDYFLILRPIWLTLSKLLPQDTQITGLYNSFIQIYRYTNHWKHYRLFMGFPSKGQRTWSNAKSARKRFNTVRLWEEKISQQKFSFTCPPDTIRRLCHMEMLNKIWHSQWHHEWVAARKYRHKYEAKFKYKSWRFGFDYAIRNKALTHFKNPFKKIKKNKRKVVLPVNKINVGLPLDFGVVYTRRIFSTNTWKKKKLNIY